MTDQQINLAIAEACGWRRRDNTDITRLVTADWAKWQRSKDGAWCSSLPNYCHDLNAMHEAESKSFDNGMQPYAWQMELQRVCGDYPATFCATARQRAEAFLRTKGLWRE